MYIVIVAQAAEAIQGAVPLSKTEPHLGLFDEVYGAAYTKGMRTKVHVHCDSHTSNCVNYSSSLITALEGM